MIDATFHQCFTNTLGNSAVSLTFHDHRIYGAADIIDGGISRERNQAGVNVDLNLGDVASIREG